MLRMPRTWAVAIAVAASCALATPTLALAELSQTAPPQNIGLSATDEEDASGDDGAGGGDTEPGGEDTPVEEPEKKPVAKIGETNYTSLDDAVEKAEEDATIELLSDCELTKGFNKSLTFTGTGKITINKQLTSNGEGWMCFGLYNPSRVLTFDGAGVSVDWKSEVGTEPWLMLSLSGTLKVTNGATFKMTVDSGSSGGRNAIYLNENSTIEISNGSRFEIWGYDTAGKEGQGLQLDKTGAAKINVTGKSTFLIDGTNRGYVNSPEIYVEDSNFTVQNCTSNASNGGKFTAVNSNVSFIDNDGHGLSAGDISFTEKTTFTARGNGYYGAYASSSFSVDGSSTVDVISNSSGGDFAGLKLTSGVTNGCVKSGAIVNIVNNYCSGLSNNGKVVFEEGVKLTITGNLNDKGTASHGGGIYNSGNSANLTLPSDAVIYNNHAKTDGDDIYNNTTSTIRFSNVGEGWKLDGIGIDKIADSCTDTIDGWYLDGAEANGDGSFSLTGGKNRWEAHADAIDGIYAEKFNPFAKDETEEDEDGSSNTDGASLISGLIALFTGGDANDDTADSAGTEGSNGSDDNVDEGFSQPTPVTVTGPIALKAAHGLGTVAVRPADITIYMGGDHGYKGTIDGEGDWIEENVTVNSLPEPGFYFTLSDDINSALQDALENSGVTDVDSETVDLSSYMKIYTHDYANGANNSELNWKLERYGGEHSGAYGKFIYRIVPDPADGQTAQPVRLQFTSEDGTKTFTSSDFTPDTSLQQQYKMKLYTELVENDKVVFEVDTNGFGENGGQKYFSGMELEDGILNIRYTTEDVSTTEVLGENDNVEEMMTDPANAGKAFAQHSKGVEFFINDSEVDVTGTAAPSLLFDDLVDSEDVSGAATYRSQLARKAKSTLDAAGIDIDIDGYQAKYLDLVDANNANVWLRASEPTTVYWPYPSGTNANTSFYLVHVKDLHRDEPLTGNALSEAITSAGTEVIPVANTGYGVKFETDGFSPFVLVWGTSNPDEPVIPTPDPDPDPSDPSKPDTDVDKELDGRDLVAGEFSFTIAATGANASSVSPRSLTGRNDAAGNVTFAGEGFTFKEAGTYTFTVSENLPSDDDPAADGIQSGGVTYDESSFTLTAEVTEGAGGKLAVSWRAPERAIAFRNSYEPSGSVDVTLGATKVLEGRDLAAGEFAFELRNRDGELVATAANAADGSVTFGAIHLTEPGTYTYTITEVAGDLEGVTYDGATHTAVITVADNGDGTLSATVSYDGGDALPVFTNVYEAPEEPTEPGEPGEPGQPSDPGKSIPQTGDSSMLTVAIIQALAVAAIAAGLVLRHRSRR